MELTLNARPLSPLSSEESLVEAARHGDDRAFEQLYGRYRDRIHAFIVSKVRDHGRAEDIGQEVFMSALRQLRATDNGIVFKPWLYTIAKNACIDEFRRGARTREVSIESDEEIGGGADSFLSAVPSPAAAIESKQSIDDLRGAFTGLSESQHRMLVMREFEGLTYDEIGERLGMTKQMVESGLFRARRKLAEEYDDLASGRRCAQIQAALDAGTLRSVRGMGIKDKRRYSRHLSHCQLCRHQAVMCGVDESLLKRSLAAKVAALLPFPLLGKLWPFGQGGGAASVASGAGGAGGAAAGGAAAAGAGLGPAAAIAALALAGAGGGLAIAEHTSHHHATKPAPAIQHHAPARPAVAPAAAPAVHTRASHAPATPRHVRADRTARHRAAGAKTHTHAAVSAPPAHVSSSPAVAPSPPVRATQGPSAHPITKTATRTHLPVASAPTTSTPTGTGPTSTTSPTRTSTHPAPSTPRAAAPTTAAPVSTTPVTPPPTVTNPVSTTLSGAGTVVSTTGGALGTAVGGAGTAAGTAVNGLGSAAGTAVSGTGSAVGTAVNGIGTAAGKAVAGIGAGTPVAPVTGAVGGALGGVAQAAGSTVAGATGAVGATATGATSAAGSTVQSATGAVGKTVSTATGALGGLLGGGH